MVEVQKLPQLLDPVFWLLDDADQVSESERSHLRLLAGVVGVVFLASIVGTIVMWPVIRREAALITIFSLTGLLCGGVVVLLRAGHGRLATQLLVFALSLQMLAGAGRRLQLEDLYILDGLVVPVFLAALLLPLRQALVVTGFNYAATIGLLVAALVFSPTNDTPDFINVQWLILGMTFALIITAAHYRNRLERERQAALHASEARYRAVSELASDFVFRTTLDPSGSERVTWASEAVYALTGYSAAEVLTWTSLRPLVHPDDRARVAERRLTMYAGARVNEELRVVTKSGLVRWVRVTSQPEWDFAGTHIVGSLNAGQDITAEREAAEALRASDERYRFLAENVNEVISLIDAEGQVRYTSPAVVRVLGYSPEASVAAGDTIVHPDDLSQVRRLFADALQGEASGPALLTYRVHKQTGEYIWVETSLRSVPNPATGRVKEVVSVTRDVTARLQTEDALRTSEARYRFLAENIRDAITIYAATGEPRYISPSCLHILGYTEEELGALSPTDPIHPDDLAHIVENYVRIFAGETDLMLNFRMRHKAGHYLWVESSVSLIKDPRTGEVVEFLTVARDVTARMEAEAALRASEARYRFLAENIHDVIVVTAEDGALRYLSPSCERQLGYRQDEVLPSMDLIHPEDWAHVTYGYTQVGPDEPTRLLTYRVRHRDGHYVWMECSVQFIRDPQTGAVVEMLTAMRDVSDRKQAEDDVRQLNESLEARVERRTLELAEANLALREREQALARANTELAQALRIKDEFLANMSHELRTPLNAILGLNEALQEEIYGPVTTEQRESLEIVQHSSQHLLALINDILDLAKIEAGQLRLELDLLEVAHLCPDSLLMVQAQARKKQLDVQLHIDPAVQTVRVDERRFRQVLINLLGNAVKFTPTGGRVGLRVTAHPDLGEARFTVWDTGIGLPADKIGRLFKPFVQLEGGLSREYEGTGLGLALVARLAALHGGRVWAESDGPGQGSRFTVAVPWISTLGQAPALPMPLAAPAPGRPTANRRVLLAEDNLNNAKVISDYLRAKGFEVYGVADGEAAVRQAREWRPDVVLMDVQMPGLNGLEAMERLRAEPDLASVPIIAVTALAMPEDRDRCLAAGATHYLSKPVALRQLVELIETETALTTLAV